MLENLQWAYNFCKTELHCIIKSKEENRPKLRLVSADKVKYTQNCVLGARIMVLSHFMVFGLNLTKSWSSEQLNFPVGYLH